MRKKKQTKHKKTKHEKFLTELSHLCGKYNAHLNRDVVSFFDTKTNDYDSQVRLISVVGSVNAIAHFVVLPKEMREVESEWIIVENKETRKWNRKHQHGKFSEM